MHPEVRDREIEFKHVTLSQLDSLAGQLLEIMGEVRVGIVSGEMGAGKTTLIKALGKALEVTDTMSSPTFSIVNEYQTARLKNVYHFDFYRIKSEKEAFDIGTEEYFYSGNYCFVEWPEKIPSLLPDNFAEIKITVENDTQRTIEISIHG